MFIRKKAYFKDLGDISDDFARGDNPTNLKVALACNAVYLGQEEKPVSDLYDEVSALYRLDQISTTAGKSDFGPLPRASVLLIAALVLCWLGMGVYVGVSYLKKRKSKKNH